MAKTIWELRFKDGRGASFFTYVDVSEDVGQPARTRTVPVAATVRPGTAIADAQTELEAGNVLTLVADMGAVAFALRHRG
jgi:hypothetical protein